MDSKSQQAEQDWHNFALAVAVVGAATATDGDGARGDLDCHDMTWVCNLLYIHHMMDCYFNGTMATKVARKLGFLPYSTHGSGKSIKGS